MKILNFILFALVLTAFNVWFDIAVGSFGRDTVIWQGGIMVTLFATTLWRKELFK